MFGESFGLAMLSDPLALPGLTSGKVVLVVWVYAIVGVFGLRMILFAAPRRFCPIAASASWAYVLASPNHRSALHRGIGIAQSEKGLPPRFSRARRGL